MTEDVNGYIFITSKSKIKVVIIINMPYFDGTGPMGGGPGTGKGFGPCGAGRRNGCGRGPGFGQMFAADKLSIKDRKEWLKRELEAIDKLEGGVEGE